MSELWRKVPENPEYELSNQGRLRGPMGVLCMPDISNRSIAAARYALPTGRDRRVYLGIGEVMKRIWGVKFVPTATWVNMVRSEVTRAMARRRADRRAAKRRAGSARGAADIAAPVPAPLAGEEAWRTLPGHPRYELSNHGRLRGSCRYLSPVVNGASAASAKYQLWVPAPARRSVSLSIRQAMLQVWNISFVPSMPWIEQVKASARSAPLPARAAAVSVQEAAPAAPEQAMPDEPEAKVAVPKAPSASKPKSGSSSGGSVMGMPCPWESGQLDTFPPGITTWDCAEMDPMTPRGENGVWVDIPLPKGRAGKQRRTA